MSSFVPRATPPTLAEPDPTKHVKYTLGMVLGVDDFTQEFAYLSGRDQWGARDLIGYGTASGLRVAVEVENAAPQVLVTPGVAVSPRGQLIRVAPAQCADLNLWLASRREELGRRLAGVAGNRAQLGLYVVLGYRECATDMVPIPGEPCRSQEETMAPSRLADDFRLELRLDAPEQSEEDALRDFVEWLGQVEVTDEPGSFAEIEELEKAIRDAVSFGDQSPPPSPPDFFHGSPPAALRIHPSMAYEYLRAAFRLWVTELRPRWQAWRAARHELDARAGGSGEEDGVLLADLRVPLARAAAHAVWQVEDAAAIEVREERRPYLVHLRMLQELVVSGRRAGGGATSGGASIGPAFSVVSERAFDLPANAGKRFDYARADHTHGTPPTPVLAGDVTGAVGSTTVAAIRNREVDQAAPAENQVLTFQGGRWRPANPPAAQGGGTLSGDVTGAANATVVQGIQGIPVDATRPAANQVLTFDAGARRWKAAAPAASAASDAVTRPAGKPAYRIVAAGVLPAVEGPAANTYNNLRVTRVGGGLVTLNFDGYQQPARPNPTQQYVVKAMAVVAPESAARAAVVTFVRFDPNADGFTLLVTSGGQPLDGATLSTVSLMVEVSQYDIPLVKPKEKDTKESKDKDSKETKEKDTKESKEKDTKESKEKDTKESKEKDTKESKEKDTKESKEKDTKESKEKDTKETKEKDTKESKDKDKDTKETKEKDTKETKEKDTKETKEKDTKETKEKDTKEKEKDTKDNKDTKEDKEEKEQKDRTKEAMSLKEIERNSVDDPATFTASGANVDVAGLEAATGDEAPTGRAFIREEERPFVGRRALELADEEPAKPEEKQPESGVIDKQAEAVN
jgi:hypothetical protein